MDARRYVRLFLTILLVLVPALVGVLAGVIAQSEAAGLPGPQAAHGSDFTLLIKPDGSLWSWGANGSGQLGNGTTTGMPVAVRVGAATDWAAVACGDLFALAIKSNGSLWSWGLNANGQLGLGDTDDRSTPQQVGTVTDWAAVAGGDKHALAIRDDGSLWSWGLNANGQLGLDDTAQRSAPVQVGSATDWDEISGGADFSAAVKVGGTLWTWGGNDRSQLGLGDTVQQLSPQQVGAGADWASVHCGDEDAMALTSGGALWSWGYNSFGQLGLGDKVIRTEPTRVGADADWDEFARGDDHAAAIKADGSLWAWGDNTYGQLGQGDTTELTAPTQVGSATNWSRVLCGDDFTTALRPGDELWGCGDNTSGDLSLGDVINRLSPTLLFITSDGSAPAIGSLTSSTHPDSAVWYPLADPGYAWSASDASGIAGYRWIRDQVAGTAAPTGYPNASTSFAYAGLADGVYYFHVRAVDRAGNWGVTSTKATQIDTTPPSVTPVRPVDGATYAQGSTVTCAWTCDDGGSGVATETARLDGSSIAEGAALDTAATGAHTFAVTATDLADNQQVVSLAYSVAPPLTFTITPTAGLHGSISPATPQTVDSGGSQTFTFTPDTGYHVANVLVDGVSIGATPTSYTFASVTADHTIRATFAIDTFTITPSAGAHGSISPSTAQTVDYGANQTFTITPASGYEVADVLVDGVSVGAVSSHTFTGVTADHTISATFAIETFTLTPSAGANGAISPATPQTVDFGGSQTFTITPDTGYHVSDVLVDGVSIGAVTSRSFINVRADHTISASFAIDTFTITPTAGLHGSISPATAQLVDYGADQTFTFTPDTGYHVADVLVDGSSIGAVTNHTFTDVTADHTIRATFAIDTFTITPSAGAHGSFSPSTAQTVDYGANLTFTITAATGYYVADVTVDGASVGPMTAYTFTNVTADHTISASFAPGLQARLAMTFGKTVVTYGGSTLLGGRLYDATTGTGLGGRDVMVEQATSVTGPWSPVDTFRTSSVPDQDKLGRFFTTVSPRAPTYFRLRYVAEPQSEYGSATGDYRKLGVRPLVGRPVAPASVRAGRYFVVYGSLKPHFTVGAKSVKVKVYRYRNGRWVYVRALSATNVDSGSITKYRLRTRLTARGKYRFRATSTAPGWAVATTIYSRMLVIR